MPMSKSRAMALYFFLASFFVGLGVFMGYDLARSDISKYEVPSTTPCVCEKTTNRSKEVK